MSRTFDLEEFRNCTEGSTFLVTVGPVWKSNLLARDIQKPQKIILRVEKIFHTAYSLTFKVFFVRQGKKYGERYLNLDIMKNLWTYTKDEKMGYLVRGDPRVVIDIKITHHKN
ncbi:MAG: hypothetical protein Q7S11_03810 [bacterium]|nr:hypothetical protein [bacterium]